MVNNGLLCHRAAPRARKPPSVEKAPPEAPPEGRAGLAVPEALSRRHLYSRFGFSCRAKKYGQLGALVEGKSLKRT